MNNSKPCDNCIRTRDPASCGNIYCEDWRGWFVQSWERACLSILRLINKEESDGQFDN